MNEQIKTISITVNGEVRKFIIGDFEGCVAPSEVLLDSILYER